MRGTEICTERALLIAPLPLSNLGVLAASGMAGAPGACPLQEGARTGPSLSPRGKSAVPEGVQASITLTCRSS